MKLWPFGRTKQQPATQEPPSVAPPRSHRGWCDSKAPPTIYGDRLKCNCDPTNPNSKSAYDLLEAIHAMNEADHAMQQALLGRVVLPDVDEGTVWKREAQS